MFTCRGQFYPVFGQYEKAVEEAREAIRLNPDFPISYYVLMLRLHRSESPR